ncbi:MULTISPECIES: hypothetical protein [unclassified Ochrobactrum]|uniref:hypothetical protein n=1 Tax=unclassified Ochrobactrum TaxID=239106 RepID=UPI0013B3A266|nr:MULTISPECIES: hypothetical protein [unclassified Ochrobactrum]MBQ0710096.1 hypothetical protein [Ochrobactrum sp. AP1BH01-1]
MAFNLWAILFGGFSNNGTKCLFIFVKAVIKFPHLLRLGAFGGDTPPQRVHSLRGGFLFGFVESAYQQCKLVD